MQRGPRRGAFVDVGDPDQAMGGDEGVGDDDVVGSGGAHAVGVPHVLDVDVADGQQRQRGVDAVVRAAQAPTMIQLPFITPVAHDHRPDSRMPPSTGRRGPSGPGERAWICTHLPRACEARVELRGARLSGAAHGM